MPKKEKKGRRPIPNYPILEGHVRDKKKLIPPILGIPQTTFISTIDLIFPEIVWVGILLEWYGLREGIEVISKILKKLWNAQTNVNWYRFSEIAANGDKLTIILNEEELANISVAFAAFRLTYDWPGLEWATSHDEAEEAKRRVELTVRKYANRFDQPYLTVVSTIIYAMAIADKMKFATGTVPDIEAIVIDWGSDRAEMAACSVRACSMAFFPHDGSEESEDWCKHFWRKNYQTSSCEWNEHAI
ncbi:hypothetical protein LZ496_12410 [Sphingomonas sp. NSE70-1]|uniref:Uncharacterized protein n=1 Tax=Sphingomonas caseinilyticus TaxID=2908205 RepID=A0ABT0RX24_9SPHN|nr:hypothetical protein [Sphingomonas caseinilyticus]MCL6699582.1 hypothetical protein [Sphingomonas caseinilyticus]